MTLKTLRAANTGGDNYQKNFFIITVLLLFALVFSSCAKSSEPEKTERFFYDDAANYLLDEFKENNQVSASQLFVPVDPEKIYKRTILINSKEEYDNAIKYLPFGFDPDTETIIIYTVHTNTWNHYEYEIESETETSIEIAFKHIPPYQLQFGGAQRWFLLKTKKIENKTVVIRFKKYDGNAENSN